MGEPFAPPKAAGRSDYRDMLRALNRSDAPVSSERPGLAPDDDPSEAGRPAVDSTREVDRPSAGTDSPEPGPQPAAVAPVAGAARDGAEPPETEASRLAPSEPASSSTSGTDVLLVQSRQADAMARHDFADLRDRELVDLFCVLDALDARLDIPTTTAKEERAREALQLFIDDRGYFPSSSKYKRWREADPARNSLPTDTTVRRAFGGSWEDVRAAFGEGPGRPDLTARRGISNGPPFEKAELSTIFTSWVESLIPTVPLSRHAFEAWLTAEADHPTTDLPRVPRSFDPFRRPDTFGGWKGLLKDHRVADRAGRSGGPRRVRSPQYRARLLDPVGPERFGGPPAPERAPADDTRLTAVRDMVAGLPDSELWDDDRSADNVRGVRAAASLLGSLVSYPQYNEVRELAGTEALSRGLKCDWPHSRQLTKRWGSWPQTKVAAKVMTPAAAKEGSTRHGYGEPELQQYLLCALCELGLGVSDAEYDAWRPGHKAERKRRGLRPRVPKAELIAARLGDGDFDAAVDSVLVVHPNVRDQLEERLFGDPPQPSAQWSVLVA